MIKVKINHVWIEGFRNIKRTDFPINDSLILIGENNSGKTNIMKAITLPLFSGDNVMSGNRISLQDINNQSKQEYFSFIYSNIDKISSDENVEVLSQFEEILPHIQVTLQFDVAEDMLYYMRKFITKDATGAEVYQIQYNFKIDNLKKLIKHIKAIKMVADEKRMDFEALKLNLLPNDFFKSHIIVPGKDKNVTYEDLQYLQYNTLVAERDNFSHISGHIGSKAIVKMLNEKIDDQSKMNIEKSYTDFFEEIQHTTKMDEVFNWQKYTDIDNAQDFFNEISILPNMPPISSLLNSVQLGYTDQPLSQQGLGYRNLIYLLAIINSLQNNDEVPFSVITIEEPEAHLCINNEKLMMSFIQSCIHKLQNIQIMYSTHSTEFINKADLNNVVIMSNGNAFSIGGELDDKSKKYLSRNPNMDLYKLFFSRRCLLVEGLSEELLIKTFLAHQDNRLNNIEIISFHKGFTKIINLWKKINKNNEYKLAVVRDLDDQLNAKEEHEKLQNENVFVGTTQEYTLEVDLTNDNFDILKTFFKEEKGWNDDDIKDEMSLSNKWRSAKGDTIIDLCLYLADNSFEGFKLPKHIHKCLSFLE